MKFEKIKIKPTSVRDDGKVFFDLDNIDLPEGFKAKERWLAFIPAGGYGGNHKHARIECFIGIGEGMMFIWQDESGKIQEEAMHPNGEYFLFVVHPYLPHAVINNGSKEAIMLEYADGPLVDVEYLDLIK